MARTKRPLVFDNGLDKKTDLPLSSQNPNSKWQPSAKMRPLSVLRRKRVLLTLMGACLVYLFVRYLPDDVPSVGRRIDSRTGRAQGYPVPGSRNSRNPGLLQFSVQDGEQEVYDGPVRFYNLALSLRPHLQRYGAVTDNVVFILHDLRAASSLIPLACEMAIYNRSSVHVAVMALQDNSIEEIVAVSGIKQTKCPVVWHDARPDHNTQSSAARQITVLNAALSHLHAALGPSVAIIDQEQVEDDFFRYTIREKLNSLRIPLAIVPSDAMRSMAWVASLTGRTIAVLNQVRVDIVIAPYKRSAGSLSRLLKSIGNANYAGLQIPQIIIDLPPHVDQFTLQYLERFQWPHGDEGEQSKLILRRGIDASRQSPAAAATRILESFYPSSWSQSHVLVLEPNVELSPDYLQYLMYVMLEYRYGPSGLNMATNVMGISLDLPDRGLDEATAFITPIKSEFNSLFWSQAPSSTAMLYFGEKWIELQDWLSERLRHDPRLERRVTAALTTVSTKHPAWLSHAQELMYAKHYYALYPGFAKASDLRLTTVHDEAHQAPEEFAHVDEGEVYDRSKAMLAISKDDVLKTVQAVRNTHNIDTGSPPISLSVLIFGKKGAKKRTLFPPDVDLLMYSSNGRRTDLSKGQAYAKTFGDRVSLEVGGCNNLQERDGTLRNRVQYFFCDRSS